MKLSALHTDLYELTMLAGYLENGMHEQASVFELYFREPPFNGGFAVFAGLQPALDYLEALHFTADEIGFLGGLGIFNRSFLDYLKDFRFRGRVSAPPEGTLVFPNEPLLTVEGTLAEAQFVETALLNLINFQTLAATKAARISLAAGAAEVIEFGLRRSQGPDGGLGLARAAAIGGVRSTSNVLAGKIFNLPVRGTHAHSWVMAFNDELAAFRAYANLFPDSCILLVDTYDTLTSGLPNALTVARELRQTGHELVGIRLDSGDLGELSQIARTFFDEAGFPAVRIVASNDLDEHRIQAIRDAGGRIDIYGVGTRLATCAGVGGGALGGVYKLVEIDGQARLKTTNDVAKKTLPGKKDVWRLLTPDDHFKADLLTLAGEAAGDFGGLRLPADSVVSLLETVMVDGRQVGPRESLEACADRCVDQLHRLPENHRRLEDNDGYPVLLSPRLDALPGALQKEHIASS